MGPEIFSRVPPEVWTIIFEYLRKTPASLHDCYQSGIQSWNDILKEKRSEYLFPLIISNLHKYLNPKILFTLRQVCKTWNESILSVLQYSWDDLKHPTIVDRNIDDPEKEWFKNTTGTSFYRSGDIELFLREMKNCTGNPFPTRTVIVKIPGVLEESRRPEGYARLYKNFGRLLEKFGEHIWVCIYFARGDVPESIREIYSIFQHCPNLRCLVIKKTFSGHERHDANYEDIEQSLEWIGRAAKEGLPPLPHLKFLTVLLDARNLSDLLLNCYGNQLISFQGEVDTLEYAPYFNKSPIRKTGLENLKGLTITSDYEDSAILNRLLPFEMRHLQRLHMMYQEAGIRRKSLKSVLQLINKHSSTLQEIRMPGDLLRHSQGQGEGFEKYLDPKLPNVEWLGIPYYYIDYSIFAKILGKFPNLKHLHFWDNSDFYRIKKNLHKELHEDTDRFWEELKSLTKITVWNRKNTIIFQSTRELCSIRQC